ncbi:NADP-dependent oxidoreductase domain-containing protein [Fomitopsis serialis]|uniref:NADP-dependent oxidoreductase domain-containing protein n=1 Tax=Fomitopsis serialis TaxID=139415 RepID=UPI002007A166|nr:NADP-dependent oxidoreductase domain-containing protein [Neoantrodia serialis]KAH9932273.1 NADP-dependent oxidoreductase domain-containing protein [Neoantrodia serialis]
MSLPTRKIGQVAVSALGYGCMGIAAFYGKPLPDEDRLKVRVLDAVYASGCTLWDTADVYADSEDLIGKWLKRTGKRSDIFLATKFGIRSGVPGKASHGDPAYVRLSCERSLKRLGVDQIDLYYFHRPDPTIPIEKTVGAMAQLISEGKVKYIGLSECSAETLRRAHAIHPIAALQVEYSPFTLDIEDDKIGLLKTARELGTTIIAYSPLGRGLLTGKYKGPDDFDPDDFRRKIPRYSQENFPNILKIASGLGQIGARHGASAGQVALAWLLAQGEDVIPIPGTTNISRLDENLGAAKITLTPEDVEEVRKVAESANATQGPRYPPLLNSVLFADTPPLEGWVPQEQPKPEA